MHSFFLQWVVGMLKIAGWIFFLGALIFDWVTLTRLTGDIPGTVALTTWVTAFVVLLPGVLILAQAQFIELFVHMREALIKIELNTRPPEPNPSAARQQ